ncbi:hypothetical protein JST99_01275 [Candidatus Dependentiae bacterium]|nr:hypothetical protein [Candidatus Dependentiae bacterium]
MKKMKRVVAVGVMSMGLVNAVYCEIRKLVATKNSDTFGWSAIQIWQNGSQVSAAKFKKSTASDAQYPQGQSNKYLFFDTDKGGVEVRFYWTADAYASPGTGAADVPLFKNTTLYTQNDLPFGTTIKINCPSGYNGTGSCKMEAAKPTIKYTKVKVVKADNQNVLWTVKAASGKLANPNKSQTYGTVNILKETGLTSRLKVPNNKDFWIVVSSNDKNDKVFVGNKTAEITEIKAGAIKSGSVINIDGQGKATIK